MLHTLLSPQQEWNYLNSRAHLYSPPEVEDVVVCCERCGKETKLSDTERVLYDDDNGICHDENVCEECLIELEREERI